MARVAVGVPVSREAFPSAAAGGRRMVTGVGTASITVTANATPHTPGAWTELIASNAEDTDWLVLVVAGLAASGVDTRGLLDVAVGAAAAEVAVVSSLPAGFTGAIGPTAARFELPIHVPKGARVSARLRALITVDEATVRAYTMAAPGRRSPSNVVTIGANTAASTASAFMTVSDTYVEITAATPQPFQGLIACPCGGVSSAFNADPTEVMTLATGAAGAEVARSITPLLNFTNAEILYAATPVGPPPSATYIAHVPAGTRIATKITTGRAYKGAIVFGIPY